MSSLAFRLSPDKLTIRNKNYQLSESVESGVNTISSYHSDQTPNRVTKRFKLGILKPTSTITSYLDEGLTGDLMLDFGLPGDTQPFC